MTNINRTSIPSDPILSMRSFLVSITVVIAMIVSTTAIAGEIEKGIIDNILANEMRYSYIEAIVSHEYKIGDPELYPNGSIKERIETLETIIDRDRFYFKQEGSFVFYNVALPPDKNPKKAYLVENQRKIRSARAFDGSTTRLIDDNGIVNIIRGRAEDIGFFRPHIVVFAGNSLFVPLSTFLSGPPGLKSHPLAGVYTALNIDCDYIGREKYKNNECVVLRVYEKMERDSNIENCDRKKIWIAIDKNYIPCKVEFWSPFFTHKSDHPLYVGEVDEFEEVEKDLWIPKKWTCTTYDNISLQKGGTKLSGVSKYVVKKFSLNPRLSRDIVSPKIPVNSQVYEIVDGKIVSVRFVAFLGLIEHSLDANHP